MHETIGVKRLFSACKTDVAGGAELLKKLAFSQLYQKEENKNEAEQMIKYSSSV